MNGSQGGDSLTQAWELAVGGAGSARKTQYMCDQNPPNSLKTTVLPHEKSL